MKKKIMMMLLAMGMMFEGGMTAFTGCGKSDVTTPQGVYEHNGNTLDFRAVKLS